MNPTKITLLLQETTKISKTYALLKKILFSLCPYLCLLQLVLPVATCVRGLFLLKLQAFKPLTVLKRNFKTYFLVNIQKFTRIYILKN